MGIINGGGKTGHRKRINQQVGCVRGEARGYAIWEGSEVAVMVAIQQYAPFASFKTHPIATESQVNDEIKALRGSG